MVAYSFNPRFELPILSGAKSGTIRALGRRRHVRAGETVQLYVGQRTRHCRLLGTAVCTSVDPIMVIVATRGTAPEIWSIAIGEPMAVSAVLVSPAAIDRFGRSDGFQDGDDMARFWATAHRDLIGRDGVIRFRGVLIRWTPLGGPHGVD
jgi:hypothetical protein